MRLLAVMFILLLASVMTGCMSLSKSPVAAQWKSSCIPIKDTKAEACVYETGGKRTGTVFYFHGLADSVKTIEASIYPKDDLIALIQSTEFSHVAVISYGKDWMLKPVGEGHRTVDEFVIIANGLKAPKPFHAIGISMGGANLATICMVRPYFFESCILTHPMLVKGDQYDVGFSFLPGFIVDNHFSRQEWSLVNPFAFVQSQSKMTRTFVTACAKDGFKLFDGTTEWVSEAQKKGFEVEWRPNNECSHSAPSFEGALDFINKQGVK